MAVKDTTVRKYSMTLKKSSVKTLIQQLDDGLKARDYKVLLLLLTELDGYVPTGRRTRGDKYDPCNFTPIDIGEIARTLDCSKKKVKKSIETLLYYDIIEEGVNDTKGEGFRFTF